ncbi:MAG: hypothetical protein KF774_20845 [Planctomyces sp.]|nr:hypothetical protein [Planctomyces sp.]
MDLAQRVLWEWAMGQLRLPWTRTFGLHGPWDIRSQWFAGSTAGLRAMLTQTETLLVVPECARLAIEVDPLGLRQGEARVRKYRSSSLTRVVADGARAAKSIKSAEFAAVDLPLVRGCLIW